MRWLRPATLMVQIVSFCSLVGLLAACSDSDSASESRVARIDAYVAVGQGEVSSAYVLVSAIATDGRVESENDRHKSNNFISQADSTTYIGAQTGSRMHLIEALSSMPNTSAARCQWVDGCANGKNGQAVNFGEAIEFPFYWRAAVWSLEENQRISLNPVTELAAALAENRVYDDATRQWLDSGRYYSPQSLVQSVSQVTQLFGFNSAIGDIHSIQPADLTRLAQLESQSLVAEQQLRYGALLAAWAHLAEGFAPDDFTATATAEFVANNGQIQKKPESGAVLTQEELYQAAADNLEALQEKHANNPSLKALIAKVQGDLEDSITELNSGLTEIVPDSLENLLGFDYTLFSTGLENAKAMVNALKETALLFSEDYRTKITNFQTTLDSLNTTNKAALDEVILQLVDVQTIYRASSQAGQCAQPTLRSSWKNGAPSCAFTSGTLTLTDGDRTITATSAAVASNAQATDVRVVGKFQFDNLQLTLKHQDALTAEQAYSFVRVFADSDNPELGFQLNWADFELQDISPDNNKEFELSGKLGVLYRGVPNPGNDNNWHYNVDRISIEGNITNAAGDSSTLAVNARSLLASSYFDATREFGSFSSLDDFFRGATATAPADITGLISYERGSEILSGQREAEYFDVRIRGGKATRYRFYEEQKRDVTDGRGVVIGHNYTFDMSTCPLLEKDGEWQVDGTCSPRTQFQGRRDIEKIINNLWRSGSLSYVTVPNKGEYFVEWPATADADGCLKLKPLESKGTLKGEGLEAAVLGIDSLELGSTIQLMGSDSKEKDTTYVLTLRKPTAKRYDFTSALAHDDERLLLNYSTNSAFQRTGSVSLIRKGVNVGTELNSNNLDLGLQQTFSDLPHKQIIDAEGNHNICITANAPYQIDDFDSSTTARKAVYSLSYRNTVYGRIFHNGTVWQAEFSDGTTVPMPKFQSLLEFSSNSLPL